MKRIRSSTAVVSRLGTTALTLVMCSAVSAAPQAGATPQTKAPCAVLDQIRGSLDDDISAGIGGVRIVINSPYADGGTQLANAETSLSMVGHGVTYMRDINENNVVPGLAPLLDKLDRANNDVKDAVEALFQPYEYDEYDDGSDEWYTGYVNGYNGYLDGYNYDDGYVEHRVGISLASPQPSTWAAIDYADQRKNDVYALVNGLQRNCTR